MCFSFFFLFFSQETRILFYYPLFLSLIFRIASFLLFSFKWPRSRSFLQFSYSIFIIVKLWKCPIGVNFIKYLIRVDLNRSMCAIYKQCQNSVAQISNLKSLKKTYQNFAKTSKAWNHSIRIICHTINLSSKPHVCKWFFIHLWFVWSLFLLPIDRKHVCLWWYEII